MTGLLLRAPELVNLHGVETGRDHLSTSSLSTLLSCSQKYFLHYEERLRQAVTPSSLALGRGFADALEAGDPEAAYRTVLEAAETEAILHGGNPWVSLPSPDAIEVGAVTARAAARAYLRTYGHSETRELELCARIRNPAVGGRVSPTHDVVARVDGVDLENAVLIEDKLTSSQSRINIDKRVRLDRQITIGAYLIWRIYGIENLEIRYRLTFKPSIKRRQSESHDAFLDRLDRDYDERPDFYTHEETASRNGDDFLRLERELWRWQATVRDARADGTWPRNTAACTEFGGCRFIAACAGEPGWEHQFVREPEREPVSA
jgi:hypothetical protein